MEFKIADFFKNQDYINPKISYDGRMVCYIRNENRNTKIIGRDLDTSKEKIIFVSNNPINEYYFIDKDGIILSQDNKGDERYQLVHININTLEKTIIGDYRNKNIEILNGGKIVDNKLFLTIEDDMKGFSDVYYMDINTFDLHLKKQNPGYISEWFIDLKGISIGGYISRDDGGIDFVVYNTNNDMEVIARWDVDDIFASDFVSFSRDGKHVYIKDSTKTSTSSLIKIDLNTKNKIVLYNDKNFDIEDILFSQIAGEVIGLSIYKDRRDWIAFNDELEEDFNFLKSLDLGDFKILSRDQEDKLWILKYEKDTSGIQYYLFNREDKTIKLLFDINERLLKYNFYSMNPIEFYARDGLKIRGYITMPRGKNKNIPLVVNVHGGPQSMDKWGFDPFVQWIVSQGYACLQINFRGSIGFGKDFTRLGYKEWGGKMQDDIIDGVKFAISEYNVDKNRVCIYGGSYGGFVALSGATFNSEIFKCAISINGPSNLITFLENMPPFWRRYEECFYKRIGHPSKDRDMLIKRSPLFSSKNIKCPVLIVQGANDPRVKREESENIVKKLKKYGIKHKYILFENEGHGIRNNDNKLFLYEKIREFLNIYL